MPVTVTVQAAQTPVTVAQIKQQTNVTFDADDTLLEMFLAAAVEFGENLTGRKFVESTFEFDADTFPAGRIPLYPNLQSVTSITYTDSTGAGQTLDPALYKVKTTALVGYVEAVESWLYGAEDILVTFKAGYPVVNDNITTPADIKQWLMVKVADFYLQRESFVFGRDRVFTMPASFVDTMITCKVVPGYGAGI